MKTYLPEHLHQCVRNLFEQTRLELRTVHHLEENLPIAMEQDADYQAKVYSMWENEADCFYATAFRVWRMRGHDLVLIELEVYVRYSNYKCSCVVGSTDTVQGVFDWLTNTESVEKCLGLIDRLLRDID